jgi:uncharacterized protein YjhX (UPF0386 family)
MDTLGEARQAFYEGKRTKSFPLAVADVVTVKCGTRNGAAADAISLESLEPKVKYLVEYSDGSSEIVALADLDFVRPFSQH